MPALPRLFSFTSIVILPVFLFSLFTLTFASPAFAQQPGPPNPQPCENTLYTDQFTKVVLEPLEHTFTRTGTDGEIVNLQHTFEVEVDFSKLAAIFAPPTSDYLESDFQEQTHRESNLLNLSSTELNSFHGPGQKAAPRVMVDQLKQKYVKYIYEKPEIAESANTYSDISGNNPKTIFDLLESFGEPNPPSLGGNPDSWSETWGLYWEKIPTAVNEFYYGLFRFPLVIGDAELRQIEEGNCPRSRAIYFVMPEYFRTTSIANQLNQAIVPKAVQSSSAKFVDDNLFSRAVDSTKTALAKIAEACLKPIANSPLTNALKKVIKISFNFLSPIKDAYAAIAVPDDPFPEKCPAPIPLLPNDKEGTGLFCSLPFYKPCTTPEPCPLEPQLEAGESCINVESPFKLDSGTNVRCTFRAQTFVRNPLIQKPGNERLGGWDKCEEAGTSSSGQPLYECRLTIRVFPTFYIPWLARIWNNTTYSDKADQIAVFNTDQETGKPGVYTFFKPNSVDFNVFPNGKNLPSKEQGASDQIKQRFFGATDCNKEFVRDIALKPKALQEALGIKAGCQTSP